jgi:hypothetical protein
MKKLLCLVIVLAACGEALDDDADPVLDGKDDSVTRRVVVQGPIEFGEQITSAFDTNKLHGYTFRVAAGAHVRIALTADAGTSTMLRLYGPRSGASWGGLPIARDPSTLDLELAEAGEYLAVAGCRNRTCTGRDYKLALACTNDHCVENGGTIRIEVDYVGYQRFEPTTAAIVRDYFATLGYDLAFVEGDELEPVDVLDYGMQSTQLRAYYVDHFDHRGQPGWHYMLMADSIAYGNRGWGMLGGDIFLISSEPINAYVDHRAEAQANIIMHELGHNLGLVHEGFEPERSAGTHNKSTCATADSAPSPDVPVTVYSPTCVEHLRLDVSPFVP